ncbi:MAG: hypothetical protein Q7S95_03005 [bacterium]|nr:hypothetical protein [bacterium]
MSKGFGWLVIIILIAIVAGLGAWWYSTQQDAGLPGTQSSYGTEAPSTTTMLPSGTNVTDTALDQDLSAIDGQIDAFASDNTSVNAGLSDQQVAQSSL